MDVNGEEESKAKHEDPPALEEKEHETGKVPVCILSHCLYLISWFYQKFSSLLGGEFNKLTTHKQALKRQFQHPLYLEFSRTLILFVLP